MAHDFMIQAGSERTYFFGYAEGFLYRAFNATEHNAGVSGDGTSITISEEEMRSGLDRAEREWSKLGYPDQTRFDDILEFKRRFDAGKLSGPYRIGFY